MNWQIQETTKLFDFFPRLQTPQESILNWINANLFLVGSMIVIIVAFFVWLVLHNKKKPVAAENPVQQAPAKHAHPSKEKSEKVPRRLRRFHRRGEAPPEGREPWKSASQKLAGGTIEPERERPSDEFTDILQELKKESRPLQEKRTRKKDLDALAENLFEESKRKEKTQAVLQELRKKLGQPIEEAPETEALTKSESPRERRHRRLRERHNKKEEKTVAETLQPTESQAQLEKLKKMEFKDLLSEKGSEPKAITEKSEKTLDFEKELGSIGAEEEAAGIEKCPNCQKETSEILYCPSCGTGFCKNCAAGFKKEANQAHYLCPTCKTRVKASG